MKDHILTDPAETLAESENVDSNDCEKSLSASHNLTVEEQRVSDLERNSSSGVTVSLLAKETRVIDYEKSTESEAVQSNTSKQQETGDCEKDLPNLKQKPELVNETVSDWILLGIAFLYNIVVGLEVTSFGVLYGDIAQHFDATQAAVGWCLGIQYFTTAFASILASYPIKRYGCRLPGIVGSILFAFGVGASSLAPNLLTIYLCYGLIGGFGYSFSVISCAVVVQQRFSRHRAVANSVSSVGYSVGSITGPQITRLLLHKFGWSGALLLMGAIQAHRIPLALLFKSPRKTPEKTQENSKQNSQQGAVNGQKFLIEKSQEKKSENNERQIREQLYSSTSALENETPTVVIDVSSSNKPEHSAAGSGLIRYLRDALDFSVLRRLRFSLLVIAMCLMIFTFGYLAHLPGKGVKSGLTMAQSVWSLSTMSFTSLVVKLFVSVFTTCWSLSRVLIYTNGLAFGCISMLTLVFVPAPAGIFLSAVFFGTQLGCTSSINHVLLVDLMGIELLPRCISLELFITGIFRLGGAPFVGWVYDITQQYDIAFLCFAGVDLLGVCLMLALYLHVRKTNSQQKQHKQHNRA